VEMLGKSGAADGRARGGHRLPRRPLVSGSR